jgi:hypothetical protein
MKLGLIGGGRIVKLHGEIVSKCMLFNNAYGDSL